MPYLISKHMVKMKTCTISIRKLTTAAIFVLLLFFYLTPCAAMDVTLAWNASTGADGYKIYYNTGSPGPPYIGTGATIGMSPTVVNSPIDIGASTRATIHLPDGAYHFALTAYNEYGESSYSTDYCTCSIQKVSAAKNLCADLFSGYSKVLQNPTFYNLDSLVEVAEAEFESSWENAEALALITGEVCPTASMEYIDDIIFLAVEDMVQQISDSLDLESFAGKYFGRQLLNEMQERCVRAFENEADEMFQMRWDRILEMARTYGVIIDSGPPSSDIEEIIDAMVTDVLADIL